MDNLNDYLAGQALKYAGALEYVEDFDRARRATLSDPKGRAALTMAYQQAQADGQNHGGQQCCGTTADWHRPWCETGPRRYRAPSCGGFNVDVMTCSFCSWKTDGHKPLALVAWVDHMAADHPVYWAQRNAIVAALYGRGTYDTNYDEACGRLAQVVLDAIGLTPDKTGEGTGKLAADEGTDGQRGAEKPDVQKLMDPVIREMHGVPPE